jgi:hypothetical protein
MVLDVSFREEEGDKHNFVSLSSSKCKLDLCLASDLWQTVGDELFFTWHIFFKNYAVQRRR